jgi:hypothetical protein
VESARILPDGKRAVVAYADGTMRVFNLKTGDVANHVTGQAGHKSAICDLDVRLVLFKKIMKYDLICERTRLKSLSVILAASQFYNSRSNKSTTTLLQF